MKAKNALILILLFVMTKVVIGQVQINLMNGDVIKTDSVTGKVDNKLIYFSAGKKHSKSIKTKKVFSINYASGTEEFLYHPDTTTGNDFTIPQMRSYIMGYKNANDNYYAPTASIGGVVFGGASAIFGVVYGPIPLALYAVLAARHYPNVAHQEFCDQNMLKDEYYLYGYQIRAKRQKLKNAFIAGAISFGFSFAVLVKNNKLIDKELTKRFGI